VFCINIFFAISLIQFKTRDIENAQCLITGAHARQSNSITLEDKWCPNCEVSFDFHGQPVTAMVWEHFGSTFADCGFISEENAKKQCKVNTTCDCVYICPDICKSKEDIEVVKWGNSSPSYLTELIIGVSVPIGMLFFSGLLAFFIRCFPSSTNGPIVEPQPRGSP